jgi:hypothetical protein
LNEAKKGLLAATRLSEQLEKKSEVITALKQEGKFKFQSLS